MKFNINAQTFARYQAISIISIIILLMLVIAGYLLQKNYLDKQTRLSDLQLNIEQMYRGRIKNEIDLALKYIDSMKSQVEPVLMEKIKEKVDLTHVEITTIYNQVRDKYSKSEIKNLIRETLREPRFFKGRGYFFIHQLDGNTVLLPTFPEFEAKNTRSYLDDNSTPVTLELIQATMNPDKAGYSRYRWYAPGDNTKMRDKISYARQFTPFNWIIGTGDYLFHTEDELKAVILKRLEHMRFGRNGYIAVFTEDGQLLSDRTKFADAYNVTYKHAVQQILAAASGNGIAEYEWYYPDGRGPVLKESLVVKVPGWNWLLVAGFYPDDVNDVMAMQRCKLNNNFIEDKLFLLLSLGILFIVSLFSVKWLTVMFSRYQTGIYDHQKALSQTAEEMRNLAECDSLTGLPNRRYLDQQAENFILQAGRYPEEQLALLFIDLDHFKAINDSLGHAAGDQVLQYVAKCLSNNVRSSDIVCRLGGDEFVILMNDQLLPTAASDLATRIINVLSQPVLIEGQQLVLTPSIGVATYPKDGQDFTTLLGNADTALYLAKEKGRNNYQFYSDSILVP